LGIYNLPLNNLRRNRLRNLSAVLRIAFGVLILLILVSSGMGINSIVEKSGTSNGKILDNSSTNNTTNETNIVTTTMDYLNSVFASQVIGNFSSTSLYSSVTLISNIADANEQNQPAYITIEMQQKAVGTLNLPTTNTIPMNTTNSTTSSVTVDNITASQVGNVGTNMASKYTVIDKNNYYYVLTYICPPYTVNQTQSAYNTILTTLNLN